MIRNEMANRRYTTDFLAAIFAEEGGELFDVRIAVLGHLQQGGDPKPFDRILAARMMARAIEYLDEHCATPQNDKPAISLGQVSGEMQVTPLEDVMRMADMENQRPRQQWWMRLRPVARMMSRQKK
jgi:6-phosphofructokinase 1